MAKPKRTYTHAVVYCGAPYGLDETGSIVSRHTTLAHAMRAKPGRAAENDHRIMAITPTGLIPVQPDEIASAEEAAAP